MDAHHLSIYRTSRYFTLGPDIEETDELWIVLHGYGYLADRFLRRFQPIDDGTRHIVAPEALSRFYLEGTRGHVGASWMTRVERLSEIDDYIAYLDAVYSAVVSDSRATPRLTVLGFSQGAATAARWACLGGAKPERLILWGGSIPPDLDLSEHGDRLRAMRLALVLGDRDEYADEHAIAAERARIRGSGITYEAIGYDGPHQIDSATLSRLVEP